MLVGVIAEADDDRCPHCGAGDSTRLVSRFARARGEDDRLDEMADRFENMGEPEGSAEMREMARELGKAMDDDVADELEEMLETEADPDEE